MKGQRHCQDYVTGTHAVTAGETLTIEVRDGGQGAPGDHSADGTRAETLSGAIGRAWETSGLESRRWDVAGENAWR
jgi:hypothetical protein